MCISAKIFELEWEYDEPVRLHHRDDDQTCSYSNLPSILAYMD